MEAQQQAPVDAMLDQIGHLKVNELLALTQAMRERFDLPDLVLTYQAPQILVTPDVQTEWSVRATTLIGAKVAAIKAVRETMGLGLKESKDFVDGLPRDATVGVSREDANVLADRLRAGGLDVEVY